MMTQAKKETVRTSGQAQAEGHAGEATQAEAFTQSAPQPDTGAAAKPRQGEPRTKPSAGAKSTAQSPGALRGSAEQAFGFTPIDNFMPLQSSHVEAMVRANQAFMDGLTAINREVIDFTDQRTRAMLDGASEAPKAGDWSDMWSFQVDYASRATEAYIGEASKLFELGMKVAQESWAPLQESVTTAFGAALPRRD